MPALGPQMKLPSLGCRHLCGLGRGAPWFLRARGHGHRAGGAARWARAALPARPRRAQVQGPRFALVRR